MTHADRKEAHNRQLASMWGLDREEEEEGEAVRAAGALVLDDLAGETEDPATASSRYARRVPLSRPKDPWDDEVRRGLSASAQPRTAA